MRQAVAGDRAAVRRLAGEVLRRLGLTAEPSLVPPPGPGAGPGPAPAAGEEAAARIDAARERLRSRIAAPEDEREG
jgi:hypothetical protein